MRLRIQLLAATAIAALFALPGEAQFPGLTLPPSGENQHSTVTQGIGLVSVTVDYNSPNVHSPTNEDRRGKIWGGLVPFGLANLGFGTCGDQCPWRGGANENTVFRVSHDVLVQGKPLPAGSYGLHFIPGKDEWTIVFSKNSTSWGSFSYDAKEDALRVTAKPEKSEYHEWLTYEFIDRQPAEATVALKWEDLALPWKIAVPNINELYLAKIRQELRNSTGFNWQNWNQAALFCLSNKVNLEEGLRWAERATDATTVGQENFTTLATLAQLQEANGKAEDAKKTFDRAINHRTTGVLDLHQLGRQLIAQGKSAEALRVFELNAKRNPGEWPVEVGLTRGLSAVGRNQEALEHARAALKQAPDSFNRTSLETMIKKLEAGQGVN